MTARGALMSATPSESEDRLELYIRQSRPLLSEVL